MAEQLNPQQQQIVAHGSGPALVIAGAGSGKTRVITHRVARLIQNGVAPSAIMMLTFTNKSAAEMAARVARAIGEENPRETLLHGTFHSMANRFLRRYASLVGYENNFTILDDSDSEDLVKAARTEVLQKTDKQFPKASVLQTLFSKAFSLYAEPEDLRTAEYLERTFQLEGMILEDYPHLRPMLPEILAVARMYRQKKRRNQAMDFDDLLENWLWLVMNAGQGLPLVRQIQYVLVDEYQDTNRVQAAILDQIVAQHQNLMVVGDDAQAIYSWRGADFHNILNFPQRYQAQAYRLEQNYRSTPDILDLANASINHNQLQFPKQLYSELPRLVKPMLFHLFDLDTEARVIVKLIREFQDQEISLHEMSVLYRNHVQSATLQMVLTQMGIPFMIRSGVKFFEQAHLKDLMSFLRIVFNPLDELAWMRVLGMLPGVGQSTAQKIFHLFLEQNAVRLTEDNLALQKYIPKKARAHWEKLLLCFKEMLTPETFPEAMIRTAYQKFYRETLFLNYENAKQREPDIEYVLEFSRKYKSLERFLNELSLVGHAAIKEHESEERREEDCLNLSTIHQAKGLEWRVVFVIGLTEGQCPHQRCLEPKERLEEERRLFYVAVTRAKHHLILTAPLMSPNFSGDLMPDRSRFVKELPRSLVEFVNLSSNDPAPVNRFGGTRLIL